MKLPALMRRLCALLLVSLSAMAMAQPAVPDEAAEAPEPVPLPVEAAAPPEEYLPPPAFLDTTDRRISDERGTPSAEQVRALEELEAEMERYAGDARSYRNTVTSLVRREYLRQRRGRDFLYSSQIREEESSMAEERERAIRIFERFLRRYPDDPVYSPDAMFRLGELYFERSSLRFQELYESAQAAMDAGDESAELPTEPDLSPTIELYQGLVERFPNYRRIDGVYYLIGYCLHEMAREEEALYAWLALVCSNRFEYESRQVAARIGEAETEAAAADSAEASDASLHPSLSLDADASFASAAQGPIEDPYAGCTSGVADSRFWGETWFRIGEYHFDDYGAPNAVELAISSYRRILDHADDRNFNLALYKIAWAYYRASRYPEAIEHFARLVDWSDEERRRTGREGSELRPEALQYLGIAFAYDDWNENQIPDPEERLRTGIQRVQDPEIVAQDRAWTADVYFQLGQVYYEEAKYEEAIQVWRLALDRWPMHERVPEYTELIAEAHQRYNQFEEAVRARAELSHYTEGSEWYTANADHPGEQQQAETLAETALIRTAVHFHARAQRLRRQCVTNQDLALCQEAQGAYRQAGDAYRSYLQHYPNNPQAYELRYNLADALFWSENYEEAAVEYGAVRDSNLDDSHLSEAARRVVESLRRVYESELSVGVSGVRDAPPETVGTPARVRPVEMPEMVERLAQARELYVARVDDEQDRENVREAYQFNNAILLYWYGYWAHARQRFQHIFEERCSGPRADETGRVAWINMREMARRLSDDGEIARLARELRERDCTFSAEAGAVAGSSVDCNLASNRENPFCLVASDLNALQYRAALTIYREAEALSGAPQRVKFEQAATMLVRAVNLNPGDPQAPLALEYAATALERTSRFESAAGLYQRILDEVGPRRSEDAEEQARLDAIVANAYFRLAYNANRFFDFDRAVENYRVLADSPRFRRSTSPDIQAKRNDALVNAAVILERMGRVAQAREYYERVYESVDDPAVKRDALYRIGQMAFDIGNWSYAIRHMRVFIQRYSGDPHAAELVVQAFWRVAQATEEQGRVREHRDALEAVVTAFSRSGQPPGSIAAEYAGHAQFNMVDEGMASFEEFSIRTGRPSTIDAYVRTLGVEIQRGTRDATRLKAAYEPVLAYERPMWSIATFVRQGRIYEVLARAILRAPFVMPADMQRQLRRVGEDAREDIRIQVQDRIQAALDEQVRPIDCLAIVRYALASRAARAGSIDSEYTRLAIDRLSAYGEERIEQCVTEAAAQDPTFGAYQRGEFSREPRGQTLPLERGMAPPSLVMEVP